MNCIKLIYCSGHDEIIRLLIENGVNINEEDNIGENAITIAARKGLN